MVAFAADATMSSLEGEEDEDCDMDTFRCHSGGGAARLIKASLLLYPSVLTVCSTWMKCCFSSSPSAGHGLIVFGGGAVNWQYYSGPSLWWQ